MCGYTQLKFYLIFFPRQNFYFISNLVIIIWWNSVRASEVVQKLLNSECKATSTYTIKCLIITRFYPAWHKEGSKNKLSLGFHNSMYISLSFNRSLQRPYILLHSTIAKPFCHSQLASLHNFHAIVCLHYHCFWLCGNLCNSITHAAVQLMHTSCNSLWCDLEWLCGCVNLSRSCTYIIAHCPRSQLISTAFSRSKSIFRKIIFTVRYSLTTTTMNRSKWSLS